MRCHPRCGFTLAELLILIASVATLAGLVAPRLQETRAKSYRDHCANNLHQIGIAYHVFLDNHGNKTSRFPGDSNWTSELMPFVDGDQTIFICISPNQTGLDTYQAAPPLGAVVGKPEAGMKSSYGVNNAASRFTVTGDAAKVLVVEYQKTVANVVQMNAAGPALDVWPTSCVPRHHGTLNVLFRDGSVQDMLPFSDIDPRIQQIYTEYWVPQNLVK